MRQKALFDNIYNTKIFNLAANITHIGRPEIFDIHVVKESKLCGSKVEIYLSLEKNIIIDYHHIVETCLLGQASAALLAKSIINSDREELKKLARDVKKMLKTGQINFDNKFQEFSILLSAQSHYARHEAILLIFEALLTAFQEFDKNFKSYD